jgi:hypothetical protein
VTTTNNSPENEQIIEGGEIQEIDDDDVRIEFTRHKAKTTRTLAYLLVATLGISVALHYGAVILILVRTENQALIDTLDGIFSSWLPVISGLTGSAVTYFFTREK